MTAHRERVVVAMSGGVDSSVAACLLVEQGYDVIGLFMRVGTKDAPAVQSSLPVLEKARSHQGCCSASDAADARFVAGMLGIPFYALNFEEDFAGIIDYFADEYARGRTPNPCVVCNDRLKFGKLMEYADAVGAKYVATGHYARVDRSNGINRLLRGVDQRKDQSYVLFGLRREILDRVLFPIGDLPKADLP
jgi:tRNA-specific 2-thiouridylase